MHCRVVSVQIQAGKTQEAIDLYQNSVVPAAKAQKGFGGAFLMTDPGSGKALSNTVWESQADIDAYRESEAHKQIQNHSRQLQGAKAVVKRYQVVK